MTGNWRKVMIVGTVLVATHAATAIHYANRYSSGIIRTPSRRMTLDLTMDQWSEAIAGCRFDVLPRSRAKRRRRQRGHLADSQMRSAARGALHLLGARSSGRAWRVVETGRRTDDVDVLHVRGRGPIDCGSIGRGDRRAVDPRHVALSLVAFASGFCPPVQEWLYGFHLTSSEIVALPMLALTFLVLSKAFLAWANCGIGSQPKVVGRLESCIQSECRGIGAWRAAFRRLLPDGLSRQAWLWFALAGVLIGCSSLTRDCIRVFAWFVAAFVIARAVAIDRRRMKAAMIVAVVLLAGQYAIRYPVQMWNSIARDEARFANPAKAAVWRYGLWFKHDQCDWYDSVGIGFGEYLDHDAAARVDAYYESGKLGADYYSMFELAQAVWKRPIDAIAFKVARLPMLWLATDRWPRTVMRPATYWCVAMYALLGLFVVVQIRRRRAIPGSAVFVFIVDRLRVAGDAFRIPLYVSDLEHARARAWVAGGNAEPRRLAVRARRSTNNRRRSFRRNGRARNVARCMSALWKSFWRKARRE